MLVFKLILIHQILMRPQKMENIDQIAKNEIQIFILELFIQIIKQQKLEDTEL